MRAAAEGRRLRCASVRSSSRRALRGEGAGDLRAHRGRSRGDDARTLLEVEGRGTERLLDVEQIDRETELAAEELGCGDVDRARRLERAHGVDAAGREVAEREGER